MDNEKYCKHIYSLLYKVKCSNNKEIIIREAEHILESSSLVIKKSQTYIKENILYNSEFKANMPNNFK